MLGWKPKSTDPGVASVRYRCTIPLRELQSTSFPVELFNPEKADAYDGVIFSKCYDIADQELAQRLRSRGSAVVLDLCDNHFYNPYGLPAYETARKNLLRMMELADLITCSTSTLADSVVAEAGLSKRPEIVGDPVEFPHTTSPPLRSWWDIASHTFKRKFRLLWFGIHGSPNAPCGMSDISRLVDVLRELQHDRGKAIELVVCSNSRDQFEELVRPLDIQSSYVDYSTNGFPGLLAQMDGVVIPVNKNPFTWAKSHNRLTTALFAGVPVVADPVPSYLEFSGFCTLGDWKLGLKEMLFEPVRTREKALGGRQYILQHWMPSHVAEQWREVLSPLLRGRTSPFMSVL